MADPIDWMARVDLSKMTVAEYRTMVSSEATNETIAQNDVLLARVMSLAADELSGLSLLEYRRAWKAFWAKATGPLADPN